MDGNKKANSHSNSISSGSSQSSSDENDNKAKKNCDEDGIRHRIAANEN